MATCSSTNDARSWLGWARLGSAGHDTYDTIRVCNMHTYKRDLNDENFLKCRHRYFSSALHRNTFNAALISGRQKPLGHARADLVARVSSLSRQVVVPILADREAELRKLQTT